MTAEEILQPIIVDISALNGLNRKVQCNNSLFDFLAKEISFQYTLFCYDSEGKELAKYRYTSTLNATMNNFVDAEGNYVPEGTVGAIPEYVFWLLYLQDRTFLIHELFPEVVKRADKAGKFNQ